MTPQKKLAIALVADAVQCCQQRRVPKQSKRERAKTYHARVRFWKRQRATAIEWFLRPECSAMWTEAAGLEWATVVRELQRRELLTP
jgi:hypothetical protein